MATGNKTTKKDPLSHRLSLAGGGQVNRAQLSIHQTIERQLRMYNELSPHLPDPKRFAELAVPSLHEAIGLKRGEARVTYDATLGRPIRIKPAAGAEVDATAKQGLAMVVGLVDNRLPPFRVSFLKANVRSPSEDLWPLDVATTATALQLFYLRAQAMTDLLGEVIRVDVSLTMPPVADGDARARVHCYLPVDLSDDAESCAAIQEYQAAVAPFWARLAKTAVGHWVLDNRVTDLRLTAKILVDPQLAISAIGRPCVSQAEAVQ